MDAITRALLIFNPKAAYKRMKFQRATHILEGVEMQRKYDGADRGRRTANMPVQDGSANTETATALALLRARSRHFARNNAYAKKGFNTIANNTVGKGIMASMKAGDPTSLAKATKIWKAWAGTRSCDFDDRMNFFGIQKLVMRTVAEAGEALVLRRRISGKKGDIPFELQVLDPDFLDASRNSTSMAGMGEYTVQGIQYNAEGKRTGYWLWPRNPYEFGAHSSRLIPAEDVLHIFELIRPGQARGVPFLHSSMLRLSDFDDYEDAELVRQKVASCFAAFIQDADPANAGSNNDTDILENLEPGVVEYLPPGKEITFATPPTTLNYGEYTRTILHGIAAGMGITYETLTGDLSNVNFSSGRMGWLEMHRQVTDWQTNMLVPQLCDRVFEWFLEMINLQYGMDRNTVEVSWTPPKREMIDPVKETEALKMQVRSGFTSWQDVIRQMGDEPADVIREISESQKMFDKEKITLDSDGRKPDGGPSGNEKAATDKTAIKAAKKVAAKSGPKA